MNEQPRSMWTRPWRSPAKALMALGLLAGSIFVAICAILLVAGQAIRTSGWPVRVALAAILLAIAAWGGLLFIHWLCSWRNFRRFLVGVACFAGLIALVLVEENVRGIYGWQHHRRQCEANGEKLDFMALLPPQVPDDRNFARGPILEDFMIPRGAPDISAEISPKRDHDEHLVLGSVDKGTFADLERCRAFYRGNPSYPEVTGAPSAPEEILQALATYDPDIKELREAAASRPLCRFSYQIRN